MDKDTAAFEISDTDWKEKAIWKRFEYLATEYGSLKSLLLIFHDRDLTSQTEKRLQYHMILWIKNPVTITSLEKLSLKAGKSFEQSRRLMFQSSKCWSNGKVVIYHYDRQVQMMKERQDTKYLLQNMKQMAVWNYYWRRFRTLVSRQNQRNGTSREKLNYKQSIYKVRK